MEQRQQSPWFRAVHRQCTEIAYIIVQAANPHAPSIPYGEKKWGGQRKMVPTSPWQSGLVDWIFLTSLKHKTQLMRSVTITECGSQKSTQKSGQRGLDYLHQFYSAAHHPLEIRHKWFWTFLLSFVLQKKKNNNNNKVLKRISLFGWIQVFFK